MKFNLFDHIGKIAIALFVVMIMCFTFAFNEISKGIEESGGLSNIAVEVGKDIKDISAEIEAYEPTEK
ncbi:TMhelix containing protein [Vibrio phage 3.058.O._10N.286.46.B8]|nr:TMhelix containing protein [Vibrio phage 2.058.O._10N.286.46.B8]AUS03175.1 TMhelix containing protein [Vibrio phage 3.058.O._10N.286.46.B8]